MSPVQAAWSVGGSAGQFSSKPLAPAMPSGGFGGSPGLPGFPPAPAASGRSPEAPPGGGSTADPGLSPVALPEELPAVPAVPAVPELCPPVVVPFQPATPRAPPDP